MTNALVQRFFDKVRYSNGCWTWLNYRNGAGYGIFNVHGKNMGAHRFSYSYFIKEPKELCVLHHCDNPPCVNPFHLFLGTKADNMIDMSQKGRSGNSKKTHCPQGHEYNKSNTRITSKNYRICRCCHKVKSLIRYHEQRRICG